MIKIDTLKKSLDDLEGKEITLQCIWCGNFIKGIGGKPDIKGQHTKECKYTEEEI